MGYRQPEPLDDRHAVDSFSCGEPALDDWLKKYALVAQASRSARVFVATTDDEPTTVVGYYALAMAQVEPDEATARATRGQPSRRPVPAILLARLAVTSDHQRSGLGKSLLKDAMLRGLEASENVGARVLLVHAKHAAAKAWYTQFGFEASPTDPLHLMMLMKDVAASLS